MRKIVWVLSAAVVLLGSCQKERSLEDPDSIPGGGVIPPVTGLLTRVVSKAGADSASNDYGYDANSRLITLNYTSTKGGNQYTRFYRNSTGLLTQFTVKSDDLAASGIDSIPTQVFYNAAATRYTYSITDIRSAGVLYRDSTIYNYDASGRLIGKIWFAKAGPSNYQLFRKDDYSYNAANNIAVAKYYSYDATTSNFGLLGTYNYSYDDKVSPLQLGAEGLLALDDIIFPGLALDGITYSAANNGASFEFLDNNDPTNNFSLSTSFTYGSNNKPVSAVSTETPGSGTYAITYYYN